MYGKLFLLAVVCVSFFQVRGDKDLKAAIENGLKKLWDLTAAGGAEIEEFRRYTIELDDNRYNLYVRIKKQWQDRTTEILASVINEARRTREDVKNSHNLQAAIECVNKFEEQGKNNLDAVYKKNHQQVYEKAIHVYEENKKRFLAVKQLANDFSVTISKTESDIRSSADATSVERTVAVFELYVKNLERNIAVIKEKVLRGYNDFLEELPKYDGEMKKDLEREVSLAKLNIRFCILIRNPILSILLGLEK